MPVNLERKQSNGADTFSNVCRSPCDTYVPADGEYQIEGVEEPRATAGPAPDVRPSDSFSLQQDRGRDAITVDPRSKNAFTAGIVLTSLGGAAIQIAAAWAFIAGFEGLPGCILGEESMDASSSSCGGGDMSGPILTAVGGVAALVGGIVLIVIHSRTRVSQSGQAPGGPESPPPPTGTWPDESPEARAMPHPMGAPLLRIAF